MAKVRSILVEPPTGLRIWRDIDPFTREVTAFHAQWQHSSETPIYLDGRPHPPDHAPYTWMGFSTAVWEGAILKITTTHIKEDYFAQLKDDDGAEYLAVTAMLDDPTYLQQPWVRTSQFRKQSDAKGWNPTPCSAQ